MIQAVRNAMRLPDLRRKLLYTLLILIIYRLAAHVPAPGVNTAVLESVSLEGTGAGGLVGMLNLLSGGAVARFSILANGVQSYITATLIFQLLQPIIPALERLAAEGEAGQRKLNQWTYYVTVPLSLVQSYAWITYLNRVYSQGGAGVPVIANFGFTAPENILPTISILVSMTAGTMFAVWLGELITEQGVGSGLSLIIFSGIVASVPGNVGQVIRDADTFLDALPTLVAFLLILVVTMFVVVWVQEGERRVPVQYGKRVRGIKMYGGGSTHIPLKVNTAGMIPLIFAGSILSFPSMIATLFQGSENEGVKKAAETIINVFSQNSDWYIPIYFVAVVGLTYFYTDMMVQQRDLPGSLQKQGGFIPGIRPGRRTADYINSVYRRITLVGALFLGAVAVLPYIVNSVTDGGGQLLITSSGLLIVVGTVLDTMRQLEAQLLMRHYDGFIK